MKKFALIVVATAVLATASITLLGQSGTTEKLATGTYIVYARSPQAFRIVVDAKTMANATLSGHFATTAGTPMNLDAFVFSEQDYWKWRGEDEAAKASAKPLYSSLKKTEGDINVKLEPGIYYVLFSNLYQYEGTKTITTDIKLTYDKK
jgi:hypothetical protein